LLRKFCFANTFSVFQRSSNDLSNPTCPSDSNDQIVLIISADCSSQGDDIDDVASVQEVTPILKGCFG